MLKQVQHDDQARFRTGAALAGAFFAAGLAAAGLADVFLAPPDALAPPVSRPAP
jgi:hypothetical protein